MKIIIGVNTLTNVDQMVYSNHINFFHHLGKIRKPGDVYAIHNPRRMPIDRMRNFTAKMALENEFDYILFIDDDVIVPIDCLDKLIAADKDIIAGHTIIRGHPFHSMIFEYKEGDKNRLGFKDDLDKSSGITNVDAVGFSCALIKCSLLRRIPPPYFVTGTHNTEDVYFCIKARKFVPECTICVDPSIETAHILGPEVIAPWNRQAYKKYMEEVYPEMIVNDDPNTNDKVNRGDNYLKAIDIGEHKVEV